MKLSVPRQTIDVKVEHGWVTLSGSVDWHFQSDEAVKAASHVIGITGVSNAIKVKKMPVASDIKGRIMAAFKRQANLDAASVTVVTEGTTVRLGGKVKAWNERGIAERAAWSAPGVTQIVDNIIVSV